MRIGVVSDTHNNLKNVRKIVELFNAEGVDRVIHTGDISQAKTLDVLAGLDAPLFGVFGNNDQEREALAQAIERHGVDGVVVHRARFRSMARALPTCTLP